MMHSSNSKTFRRYAQLLQSGMRYPDRLFHVYVQSYSSNGRSGYYKLLKQCTNSFITCMESIKEKEIVVCVNNLETTTTTLPNDEKELHNMFVSYAKQIYTVLEYLYKNYIPKQLKKLCMINNDYKITLCSHGLGATISYWTFVYTQEVATYIDKLVLLSPIVQPLRNYYQRPKHTIGPNKRNKIFVFYHARNPLSHNIRIYMNVGSIVAIDNNRNGSMIRTNYNRNTIMRRLASLGALERYHQLHYFT